jgi:hypothetical protein
MDGGGIGGHLQGKRPRRPHKIGLRKSRGGKQKTSDQYRDPRRHSVDPRFHGRDDGSSDITSIILPSDQKQQETNNKKQECDLTGEYHGFRVYGR